MDEFISTVTVRDTKLITRAITGKYGARRLQKPFRRFFCRSLRVSSSERWVPEVRNKRRFVTLQLGNVGNAGNVGKGGAA
jgi:hypothetical protein